MDLRWRRDSRLQAILRFWSPAQMRLLQACILRLGPRRLSVTTQSSKEIFWRARRWFSRSGAQITCGRAFTDTAAGTAVTFAGNNPATTSGTPNLVSNTCTESSSGYNGGVTVTQPNGDTGVGSGDTGGNGGGPSPVPEPGTWALLASGLLATVLLTCGKLRVSSLGC